MEIFTNAVPTWFSALFLMCFLLPIIMIVRAVKTAAINSNINPTSAKKIPQMVALFLGLYYLFVALMSYTGIFQKNTLPPKILGFTALPLIVFYFLVVYRAKIFWTLLKNIKLSALVRIHLFRFVGIFFILGWQFDILPKSFALIGGLGDIFVAFTAIFVARLIDKKVPNYKRITLIWNIIGLWDILSVLFSAIIITKQAIATNTTGILEMTKFPFSLIPAFAPATIIFLHICIFKKLKMQDKTS
ncbi:MAG TPA: hypothetical protein PLJ00_11060 [Chitinophagales bacterium]|nr:hypothetical protein [Chitinophagales bacterium]HRG86676.1 hypothetical protein [Chitinophagales bacterium]HRH54783.1 hypothetical protein [Chitinophagales bacterium]